MNTASKKPTCLPNTSGHESINFYDYAWSPKTNPEFDKIDFNSFSSTARKIIQITSSQSTYSNTQIRFKSIIALCDDGTLWELELNHRDVISWKQLPEIPQTTGNV